MQTSRPVRQVLIHGPNSPRCPGRFPRQVILAIFFLLLPLGFRPGEFKFFLHNPGIGLVQSAGELLQVGLDSGFRPIRFGRLPGFFVQQSELGPGQGFMKGFREIPQK